MHKAFLTIISLTQLLSILYSSAAQSISTPSMNGIQLEAYKDFPENWKLVTVRFRQDTREMRFTYANPIAYKALLENSVRFPKGSIFAKIGMMTDVDPLFSSSVVPSGAKRYQFMVKDDDLYATTDGWGYALFDSRGELFPGSIAAQSTACYACHKIADSRGQVFSQIASFRVEPLNTSSDINSSSDRDVIAKKSIQFREGKQKELPDFCQIRRIKKNSIRIVDGEIGKNNFSGTFNEIQPMMIQESLGSRTATAIVGSNKGECLAVFAELNTKKCNLADSPIWVNTKTNVLVQELPQKLPILKSYQKNFCTTK